MEQCALCLARDVADVNRVAVPTDYVGFERGQFRVWCWPLEPRRIVGVFPKPLFDSGFERRLSETQSRTRRYARSTIDVARHQRGSDFEVWEKTKIKNARGSRSRNPETSLRRARG